MAAHGCAGLQRLVAHGAGLRHRRGAHHGGTLGAGAAAVNGVATEV